MAALDEFDTNVTATYRLQLHKDFTFADAEKIVPYLARLGVSHVYASPITMARAGSMHGYDVVDFTRVNPELGGEAGLGSFVKALKAEKLGLIIDIVPNHMAVGGADNANWLDLLLNGPDSRYADFFDVDFNAADANGKIIVPFLGSEYEKILAGDDFKLRRDPATDRYVLHYGEHLFPLRDVDQPVVAEEGAPEGGEVRVTKQDLHALLEAQHYRLAGWRAGSDLVNYRRFFEITSLGGIKIEREWVFEHVHQLPLALYERGWIDGVRIDHVDGLTDPAAYCERLRTALLARRELRADRKPPYVVLEKILAGHERLPKWAVHGTTGYDFMNEVSALQHSGKGEAALNRKWREISGRSENFEVEELLARRELLDLNFAGQLEGVVDAIRRCVDHLPMSRDLTRGALRRAVRSTIAHLRVYRSYAVGSKENPGAGGDLEAAFAAALAEPTPESEAIQFFQLLMADRSGHPTIAEAIRRFHQLCAPAAAKSVEDTGFYRYGRLLSRNDVGFDAGVLSMPIEEFHSRMEARANSEPHAMLATATHDHKRGEDTRARLAVLSEVADKFVAETAKWREMNEGFGRHANPADEYMLFQTLVGAWPLDLKPNDAEGLKSLADRLTLWQQKALREGKLRSSWLAQNAPYEEVMEQYIRAALDPGQSGGFLQSVAAFVEAIAPAGLANSLTQCALKCLAPGVPDTYQGCEFWDFTLVDPDNRRPVDYPARERALGEPAQGEAGSPVYKQEVLHALLALRRREQDLFANGDYAGLATPGAPEDSVIALKRTSGGKTVMAALQLRVGAALFGTGRMTPTAEFWVGARLDAPAGAFRSVAGDPKASPTDPLARIFARSPVAVWVSS